MKNTFNFNANANVNMFAAKKFAGMFVAAKKALQIEPAPKQEPTLEPKENKIQNMMAALFR